MKTMLSVQPVIRLFALHRRRTAALLFLTCTSALLYGVGDPVSLKLLVDTLSRNDTRAFVLLALLFLALYTGIRLARWRAVLVTQDLKNDVYEDVTTRMFRTFFRLPYREITKDRAYYVSRISDEPLQIAQGVDVVTKLAGALATMIGALTVCLWLSWKIAIVLSVIVPVLLRLSARYGSRISGAVSDEKEMQARFREGLGRAVASYKTVNMFGLHEVVESQVSLRLRAYLRLFYGRVAIAAAFQAISGIFLSYAEMIVLLGAGIEVIRGDLTIGGLFGFTSAYWRVVGAFKQIADLVPEAAELSSLLKRAEEFHGRVRDEVEGDHESIMLEGAAFAYENKRVFESLDLAVGRGERLLVTGPNGSGKTTLAHIVTGFLPIDEGEAQLPRRCRMSGLLLPFEFIPGTLKDHVNFDQLSSARQAQFLRLVDRFNLGDKLDRDPASMSEGEKRKFQIALTLFKDAAYYVLDEPLANVDSESKVIVMEEILESTRGKSLIVIMHDDGPYRDYFNRQLTLGSRTAEMLMPQVT
jgi:ABC-type multidrug transport system fused ATPase/permease subunit